MSDHCPRPGRIAGAYGRRYPDAWRQVDECRARRKELGNWPEWCFLPLAVAQRIVAEGDALRSPSQAHLAGMLAALAAWRVTQGIYRFDATTLKAVSKMPITGDIPSEVLLHLPEWCVYVPTPEQTWQGSYLNGFFAHLDYDMIDRRADLRLLLDLSGPAGDQLEPILIRLGKGGIAAGVEAHFQENGRQFPVTMHTLDGECEQLTSDVSPLVSLVLYLASRAVEIREVGGGSRVPVRPKAQKTKKGLRLFPPDHPTRWEVGFNLASD
jgi:hypothetical protein